MKFALNLEARATNSKWVGLERGTGKWGEPSSWATEISIAPTWISGSAVANALGRLKWMSPKERVIAKP
eukprot:5181819-Amphidinium_carterae.2